MVRVVVSCIVWFVNDNILSDQLNRIDLHVRALFLKRWRSQGVRAIRYLSRSLGRKLLSLLAVPHPFV